MSLVEVMVVIAIIVTLMGIIGFGVMTVFSDSKVSTTELQMHELNKRIELYSLKKGPPSTSEGLKAVYKGDDVPKDSWDNEFIYIAPGPNGLPYDVISHGSDGSEGGTDNAADIKLSELKK
jgi:general secretion pathway protein G